MGTRSYSWLGRSSREQDQDWKRSHIEHRAEIAFRQQDCSLGHRDTILRSDLLLLVFPYPCTLGVHAHNIAAGLAVPVENELAATAHGLP
eukprot:COSAG04_NODE_37_length_33905_cov_5.439951_4_plen_90_part_00